MILFEANLVLFFSFDFIPFSFLIIIVYLAFSLKSVSFYLDVICFFLSPLSAARLFLFIFIGFL